jgi:hypothetical protein
MNTFSHFGFQITESWFNKLPSFRVLHTARLYLRHVVPGSMLLEQKPVGNIEHIYIKIENVYQVNQIVFSIYKLHPCIGKSWQYNPVVQELSESPVCMPGLLCHKVSC